MCPRPRHYTEELLTGGCWYNIACTLYINFLNVHRVTEGGRNYLPQQLQHVICRQMICHYWMFSTQSPHQLPCKRFMRRRIQHKRVCVYLAHASIKRWLCIKWPETAQTNLSPTTSPHSWHIMSPAAWSSIRDAPGWCGHCTTFVHWLPLGLGWSRPSAIVLIHTSDYSVLWSVTMKHFTTSKRSRTLFWHLFITADWRPFITAARYVILKYAESMRQYTESLVNTRWQVVFELVWRTGKILPV